MFAHLNPHNSEFGDICALYSPFLSLTCVPAVVCGTRKRRPCLSYSRRRDPINLGLFRGLDKARGGGGGCHDPALVVCVFRFPGPTAVKREKVILYFRFKDRLTGQKRQDPLEVVNVSRIQCLGPRGQASFLHITVCVPSSWIQVLDKFFEVGLADILPRSKFSG